MLGNSSSEDLGGNHSEGALEHNQIRGACFCNAVQFSYEPPSLWCAHCHCTMCQRAHGAGFVTWIGADTARFKLHQKETLRWFVSSPGARRGFCGRCGSTLFFESTQWPGETHIARANLTTAPDLAPQRHVYFADHADWLAKADDLPVK